MLFKSGVPEYGLQASYDSDVWIHERHGDGKEVGVQFLPRELIHRGCVGEIVGDEEDKGLVPGRRSTQELRVAMVCSPRRDQNSIILQRGTPDPN